MGKTDDIGGLALALEDEVGIVNLELEGYD
jgi:hypothetical protein